MGIVFFIQTNENIVDYQKSPMRMQILEAKLDVIHTAQICRFRRPSAQVGNLTIRGKYDLI